MFFPKRVKHRKWHKGVGLSVNSGVETRGTDLAFGSFGLKALGSKWITTRQLEASRLAIIRYLRKGGKLWVRIFPDKPVTKKGIEVPMGGGKGGVDHYVFPVKAGRVIFELEGISEKEAKEAFSKAGDKLPIKTRFITK
ncbi:MAG: 50S ribosomal protein L16 [Candidatus Parcubacteria bacterium]|nr:50S ribosomal protein L16 [Candidatus Parcubacteria bacterium]